MHYVSPHAASAHPTTADMIDKLQHAYTPIQIISLSNGTPSSFMSAPYTRRSDGARNVVVAFVLLILLLALSCNVASATARGKRTVVVCNNGPGYAPTIKSKPRECLLYDYRRYTRISNLRWRRWGKRRAIARGLIYVKPAPNRTRIRVVLARVRSTTYCRFRWYSRATIHILSGARKGRTIRYSRPPVGDCIDY